MGKPKILPGAGGSLALDCSPLNPRYVQQTPAFLAAGFHFVSHCCRRPISLYFLHNFIAAARACPASGIARCCPLCFGGFCLELSDLLAWPRRVSFNRPPPLTGLPCLAAIASQQHRPRGRVLRASTTAQQQLLRQTRRRVFARSFFRSLTP